LLAFCVTADIHYQAPRIWFYFVRQPNYIFKKRGRQLKDARDLDGKRQEEEIAPLLAGAAV
jgi:hypothetical protein